MPVEIVRKIKAALLIITFAGAEIRQVQERLRSQIGLRWRSTELARRGTGTADEEGLRRPVFDSEGSSRSAMGSLSTILINGKVEAVFDQAVDLLPPLLRRRDFARRTAVKQRRGLRIKNVVPDVSDVFGFNRKVDRIVDQRLQRLQVRANRHPSIRRLWATGRRGSAMVNAPPARRLASSSRTENEESESAAESESEEAPLPLDDEGPARYLHHLGLAEVPGAAEPWRWRECLRIAGPGLMTCLADTDGPCLQTAASSGVQYKYSLVMIQILLIPVLYAAQELTVRLSLATKDGLTGLIRRRFGKFWAWFACTLHVLMCLQQQMGEFGCISQLATDVWGVQKWWPPLLYFGALFLTVVLGGSYFRWLEIFGMAAGSCQMLMIAIMFKTRPFSSDFFKGIFWMPFGDLKYSVLLSSNIGAVIMPWMLYYQQSACCERKLKARKISYCRAETALGSVLAQFVILATVVALGKTAYGGRNSPATGFAEMVVALSGPLGSVAASKTLVSVAVVGACTCASICLMVTPIWSICEIMKWNMSFDNNFSEAPMLYSLQIVGLVLAYAMAVGTTFSSTPSWAIVSQVVNALLILPVAVFLWLLASDPKILPSNFRLQGFYKWLLFVVFSMVSSYCVFGTIMTIAIPP